ncbi:hypothetical protein [Streptomyces griseofuscus]|uniref:hypothetical protein n=1 Tax=Streptomyces griseofuscus TaxID=146922 RepID=UPI0033FD8B01
MTSIPSPSRYHLLLTADGQPVQHGWWGTEATARRKMAAWIGDWGRPGARIALTDEEAGEQLAVWPEEGPVIVGGAS